jgi:hypothetical protein
MEDKRTETVNIYMKTDSDKEHVLLGAAPHEKYLILINETLQSENKELVIKNKELETANECLTDDSDTLDVSMRYTKGLLKNLVVLDQLRKTDSVLTRKITTSTIKYIENYKKQALYHLRILYSIFIASFGIMWETEYLQVGQFTVVFFMIVISILFIENMVRNLKIPTCVTYNTRIKDIQNEIKVITDAQDFLSDHIDNL